MRWPLVRRSRLDEAQQTTGVYRCRRCGKFIPLGFGHRVENGGECEVVAS